MIATASPVEVRRARRARRSRSRCGSGERRQRTAGLSAAISRDDRRRAVACWRRRRRRPRSRSPPARASRRVPATVSPIDSSSLWAGMTTESFSRASAPALRVGVVDLAQDRPRCRSCSRQPRVVVPNASQVADPPAVVADPRLARESVQSSSRPAICSQSVDRLEHRARSLAAAAEVVDGGRPRARVEGREGGDEVGAWMLSRTCLPP